MPQHINKPQYKFKLRYFPVGAQMLFVAFGALVLVPLLTGLNPNVALFTAGAGTLLFQVVTKGKVPIFLASSFAFIAPISIGVQKWGIKGTMCGLVAAGFFYMFLSVLIKFKGIEAIKKVLPTIVTGPVIMVIGLILAPVAVNMAIGKTGDGNTILFPEKTALIVSMIALITTVLVSLLGKGFWKLVPIICGIITSYTVSLFMGIIDFTPVMNAPWLTIPDFVTPEWNLEAIIYILPIAIAPAIEHFGDVLAISSATGQNYLEDPGIHRTMMGDGLATSLASFLGGPPNTTYSEVTGAIVLTKIYNPAVMTWAAICAILLAFVGKLGAILQTIPLPAMGGIMLLLFGSIMVVGLNSLVKQGEDLLEPRNLTIVGLIIILGVGGMSLNFGEFTLSGIGLAGVVGIILNLSLPNKNKNNSESNES